MSSGRPRTLPPELRDALENVAVVVEEADPDDPDLFGLSGVPPSGDCRTNRSRSSGARSSVLSGSRGAGRGDPLTVLHELAHYFGIDEDRLDELGYG